MNTWRKLAALILSGIMIFALAACGTTETPTEAPTEAPTETQDAQAPTGEGSLIIENMIPSIDPETYKGFIYTWYADGSSASYRLTINDDSTWSLTDAATEIVASGSLRLNDEDQILELYDPDGSLAISATLEKEDTMHIELMMETLSDTLSTNVFLNKITNDISDAPPSDVQEEGSNTSIEEESSATHPADEEIVLEETTATN